jgi:hypothetical protein
MSGRTRILHSIAGSRYRRPRVDARGCFTCQREPSATPPEHSTVVIADQRQTRKAIIRSVLIVATALALNLPSPALPHGGGLDSYGCHNNRKAGGYHCHRGALAGQAFGSQAEMLQQLKGGSSAASGARATGTAPSESRRSIERRLQELNDLRDKGLVTPEEYDTKRREILRDL